MIRDYDKVSSENGFYFNFRIRQCSRLCRFARIFSQILAFTLAMLYFLEHSTYQSPIQKQIEHKSETNLKTFMNVTIGNLKTFLNVTNGNLNGSPSRTTNNPTQDHSSSNVAEKPDEASKVNTYLHLERKLFLVDIKQQRAVCFNASPNL